MSFKSYINECECGVELDGTGYSLLNLQVWWRTSLAALFYSVRVVQLFERAPTTSSPRDQYIESENRPDVLVCDALGDSNTELDLSIARP